MRGARQALAVMLWVAAGCGDAFEGAAELPPCNTDPWSCEGAQTCWVNTAGDGFACLNPGPGTAGASCSLIPGSVDCESGLFCNVSKVCQPFCDPANAAHPCPAGMTCNVVDIMDGPESIGAVQVCH